MAMQAVVICWKIRIFAYWTTPLAIDWAVDAELWFAEKFVSLLIEQHLWHIRRAAACGCDLLKNSYLCLLNNTNKLVWLAGLLVVICWKIRIFAYWTTPHTLDCNSGSRLWFAEKFVSLLIEQHRHNKVSQRAVSCDLLKNSYLCLLNNTRVWAVAKSTVVVICWKIRIFAYWTTPVAKRQTDFIALWFAEKFVSLLIEQHLPAAIRSPCTVVICWKIRIFAYWTTPCCFQEWGRF